MLLLNIIKKLILSILPLLFFYILKIVVNRQQILKKQTHIVDADPAVDFRASKSRIEEAEIVEDRV